MRTKETKLKYPSFAEENNNPLLCFPALRSLPQITNKKFARFQL
jgi:hypothetical protein